MNPELQEIIKESMDLGTREITIGYLGKSVRFFLEPEKEHIQNLNVFISHASTDRDWAENVAKELQNIGFNVIIVPSVIPHNDNFSSKLKKIFSNVMKDEQIEEILESKIDNADYLIILVSKRSVKRDWVRFESKLAAKYIGRVLFLLEKDIPANFNSRTSKSHPVSKMPLYYKYTIMIYPENPYERGLKIARELINDPDEGRSDGRMRPLVIHERDLRKENRQKHFVRKELIHFPQFNNRYVVDVFPFFWRDIGIEFADIDMDEDTSRHLFSWKKIPGNDSERLVEFLKKNYDVDWVKRAQIEKIDEGRTIKMTNEKSFLTLSLNILNTQVDLKIDDGRIDKFVVKKENGELNIYPIKNIHKYVYIAFQYFVLYYGRIELENQVKRDEVKMSLHTIPLTTENSHWSDEEKSISALIIWVPK